MKFSLNLWISIVGLGGVAGLAACSLEPKSSGSQLVVSIPGSDVDYVVPFVSLAPKVLPGTLDGFSCLAVNVTGPGIPDSSKNPEGAALGPIFDRLLNRESYCAYRGVIGGPILKSGGSFVPTEVSLSVPTGALRLVQVVGVTDPAGCIPGQVANEPDGSDVDYYEVGRSVLSGVFSDRSTAISNEWNTAANQADRLLDCGDGGGCSTLQSHLISPTTYSTDGSTVNMLAQPMTFAASQTIHRITLKISADAAGPAQIRVLNHQVSPFPQPTFPPVTNSTATATVGTGTPQNVTFFMNPPNGITVTAGTTYWIVLEQASGGSAVLHWAADTNVTSGAGANAVKGMNLSWAQFPNPPDIKSFHHMIVSCP